MADLTLRKVNAALARNNALRRIGKHRQSSRDDLRRPAAAKTTNKPPKTLRHDAFLKAKAVQLAKQLGVATTKDFAAIGVSRHYLCKLRAEGVLIRKGYALYAAPEALVA